MPRPQGMPMMVVTTSEVMVMMMMVMVAISMPVVVMSIVMPRMCFGDSAENHKRSYSNDYSPHQFC